MRKLLAITTALSALFVLQACSQESHSETLYADAASIDHHITNTTLHSSFIGVEGEHVGEVEAIQTGSGVLFRFTFNNLPPGLHGLHLHKVGTCEDVGSFTLSTGHVNFHDTMHGMLNENGHHSGDLPNILIDESGHGHVDIFQTGITLDDGPTGLIDEDGTALIMHANQDDYDTQPIGGAGPRIACAAF